MKSKISTLSIGMAFVCVLICTGCKEELPVESNNAKSHVYASWETMEYDKCVSAWLITRFIDSKAKFVFYPKETEITEGIVFDVPGAKWSRQHRKCTSQCIWESMDKADVAIEEIISIAGKVELNFWQLDRWPQAQQCFDEVMEILHETEDMQECFNKTGLYFDRLYNDFKNEENDGKSL